jgi:LuxR family maltose regulon positive regulatory protein
MTTGESLPSANDTTTVLLATKLSSPPTRPGLIARPRLVERLRQGQRGPLTLISAPAGSGKTTAISAWAAATGAHAVWVSLDAEDNDPARFWSYICAACDRLAPGCGTAALALLQAPQPAPLPIVVTTLINSLTLLPSGAGPERPYVLILDDYQFIETPSIHEALALLIERLPPQIHLAMTARADPPLPLARLRARGFVTELRAADLRFSRSEARALMEDVAGLRLNETTLAALDARTEGWAAGLQLAALALHDQPDREAFIAAFAGSHSYIVDYLADEVLSHQPAHIRTFLLQTAILDRFCGPLCDAVLGVETFERSNVQTLKPADMQPSYSQLILQQLERANLFLVRLDGQQRWYRYHHLFADVLRARLRETALEIEPELHRRASAWYEHAAASAGPAALRSAIRHVLAAGDTQRAAQLLDRSAEALWNTGNLAPLLELIRLLPDGAIKAHPRLAIVLARALLTAGDLDAVDPLLQAASAALERSESVAIPVRTQLQGWVAAIESHVARLRERFPEAITQAHQALALLGTADESARGFVMLGLAMALHVTGDLIMAVERYDDAAALLAAAGDVYMEVMARGLCGSAWIMRGELARAKATLDRAVQRCGEPPSRLPIAAMALAALGDIAYQRNQLAEAQRLADECLILAEQGQVRDALFVGHELRVKAQLAMGELDAAEQTAATLIGLADTHRVPLIMDWARSVAAWVALVQGRVDAARRWTEGYRPWTEVLSPIRADEFVVFLRVLLATQRADEALGWIARQLPQSQAVGNVAQQIQLLVLKGLAHTAQQEAEDAQAALGSALALAAPGEMIRPFLDAGALMADPIARYIAERPPHDVLGRFGEQILQALEVTSAPEQPGALGQLPAPAPLRALSGLDEPLTPREHEILRMVAAGRTNQEIAETLVVSVGTVKTHLHHLYGKLDARDRTHAVARARELGVLG